MKEQIESFLLFSLWKLEKDGNVLNIDAHILDREELYFSDDFINTVKEKLGFYGDDHIRPLSKLEKECGKSTKKLKTPRNKILNEIIPFKQPTNTHILPRTICTSLEKGARMNLEIYNQKTFEDIKHINDDGIEFWYARELQEVLGYAKWGNFLKVIEKAKQSLQSSNIEELDHFADVGKIVKAGVSSKEINDMILSRYACYLIVQNGDPRKKMIALGQQYFAIQTRKQELTEKEFEELSEDERRLILRKDVTGFNKKLFAAAKDSGVNNFAQFNNAGYRGLYGGERHKI
ncbi:DNA-damage-inducible protein D [Fusobacterium necrophorum subsp. necrophorum]|nr:DNA-damage-inducible protein D [Fusobacterium necrophorum subsp. necrophorum]